MRRPARRLPAPLTPPPARHARRRPRRPPPRPRPAPTAADGEQGQHAAADRSPRGLAPAAGAPPPPGAPPAPRRGPPGPSGAGEPAARRSARASSGEKRLAGMAFTTQAGPRHPQHAANLGVQLDGLVHRQLLGQRHQRDRRPDRIDEQSLHPLGVVAERPGRDGVEERRGDPEELDGVAGGGRVHQHQVPARPAVRPGGSGPRAGSSRGSPARPARAPPGGSSGPAGSRRPRGRWPGTGATISPYSRIASGAGR